MRINNLFNVIWKNVQKLNVAALAAAGLIAGVSLVMGCANPAGGDDDGKKNLTPTFFAVTNITGIVETTAIGAPINLSAAAVEPATATSKTIAWSIAKAADIPEALVTEKSINTAAVLLDEDDEEVETGEGAVFGVTTAEGKTIKIVTPNKAGTLVLRAVIANGKTADTAYEQFFVITAAADFVAVTNITGISEAEVPPDTLINLSAAVVAPENATNKDITWSIVKADDIPAELVSEKSIDTDDVLLEAEEGDDAGAAFVEEENGEDVIKKVKLLSEGTLVLRAVIANGKADGNYTRHFVIKAVEGVAPPPVEPGTGGDEPGGEQPVFTAVTSVVIQQNESDVGETLTLSPNAQVQLSAVVSPSDASNKNISWSSDTTAVATVSDGGLVTAVAVGTAVITATGADTKSDSVTVTVAAGKGVYNSADDNFLAEINSLAGGFDWIKENGANDGEYTIKLADDENITETYKLGTYDTSTGANSLTGTHKNLMITLKSVNETTITLTKTVAGAMFIIYGFDTSDVPTLILDSGITLHGYSANNNSLVVVGNDTTKKAYFEMKDGSEIKGNIMTAADYTLGGGVYIYVGSTFTMYGGKIHHNKLIKETICNGGGVYNNGTFTMYDGEVSYNETSTGSFGTNGGGVYSLGTFNMSGGKIIYNKLVNTITTNCGGGVFSGNGSTFNMNNDAVIGYNEAARGGGVYLTGVFTMSGGSIEGNTASSQGAGVYKTGGSSTFRKTGGIIYGMSDGQKSNIPTGDTVYVIQVGTSTSYGSNANAGTNINITSTSNTELIIEEQS
jgi:uncharacterized protein YjdB